VTHALSPYLAAFGSRFREELQYRAAALAGLVTQVVFGFILLMVLLTFHRSADEASPMSPRQVVAYIWLGQSLFGLLPWNVEPAALAAIRSGDVVQGLLRPVGAYPWWFARAAAWRVVRTGLRSVPMATLAVFVFPVVGLAGYAMPVPPSAAAAVSFAVGLGLAVWLSVALTVMIQASMFWTVSPDGVLRVVPPLVILLSGNLIPLPLLPDAAQAFLGLQPFCGLVDTPARLYTGQLTGDAALRAMGLSVFWCVALTALGAGMTRRGLRRLEVAGG